MRFGLHSGPVTAGVLRGDRARFQLFGDTVNTGTFLGKRTEHVWLYGTLLHTHFPVSLNRSKASRMESTGVRNKIQVSQGTANYLMAAGKSHWLSPRVDGVKAKGKGVLDTYWVSPESKQVDTGETSSTSSQGENIKGPAPTAETLGNSSEELRDSKTRRLVSWMVELLLDHVTKIVSPVVWSRCVLQSGSLLVWIWGQRTYNTFSVLSRTLGRLSRSIQQCEG